ncbi:myosin-9-like [Branchiostoma lanceolatum]|uniref:myosin-9-like n=1 Tax=Branchiostoma lanceolatum TaxID=7740 RepID=UPI0034559A8F
MAQAHVRRIDDNFQLLLYELELSPRFYRLLQAKKIFSSEQIKRVKAESTTSRRKARLLTLLRQQDRDVVGRFCDVLVDTDQRALERLLRDKQHQSKKHPVLSLSVDQDSHRLETGQRQKLKTKAKKLTGEIETGLEDENFVLERLVGGMLRTRAQALEEKLLQDKIRSKKKALEKNMLKELQAKVQALEKELNDFREAQQVTYEEKENAIRERDLAITRILELEKALEEVVQERDFMRRERDAAVRAEWLATLEKTQMMRAREDGVTGRVALKETQGAPPGGIPKKRTQRIKMKPAALRALLQR